MMGYLRDRDRMPAMGPELGLLVVQIVRWIDDHNPGFVACEFGDAWKRIHTLIDKVPLFTVEDLCASSLLPRPGGIRCTVLERWRELRAEEPGEFVRVYIGYPDNMETTEGLQEFVVQSSNVTWIPRGHREENPPGFWRWVEDE
jgi:hypothetical protein